ncbi:MAG: SCP2 sterol-binding domain-containing protein [Chromatiales bacterium]|nr:SCP2 sterol-binding domain-containing protein [Chromatiales bacterium]
MSASGTEITVDLPFSSVAFRPVELLINRGVGLSSTARAMAVALEARSLDVRLDGTPLALRLSARDGQVRVTAPGDGAAAATLAGPPLAMIRLLGGDPQALIREGEVRITGDTDIANQFRDLLHMARPDLEEELSKLVGDPVAHQVGNLARGFADWGLRAAESLSRSVGEYLTEERRTLPTRVEVDEFYRDVDRVANDVERAEARLARLKGKWGHA